MKTDWDYTTLADAYVSRPPYSEQGLADLFAIAGLAPGAAVCDIGAGAGHLTIPLARAGFTVTAVEPNDAMRSNGVRLTRDFPKVQWVEAGGEATGLPAGSFDFVTFGSSFNVLNRGAALQETHRLLKSGRWFACLWNHRRLDDPIQARIEEIIKEAIPQYDHGTRREDQTDIIKSSGLFTDVRTVFRDFTFVQPAAEVIKAWSSHATLARQAGDCFQTIVERIAHYLKSLGKDEITIPYTTRAWIARRKD
jgi:ubiquinone/menaquinone biosynthesis C-methylase UbiE